MSATAIHSPKVPLGRIVATHHALEVLAFEDILSGIRRHEAGDWGEVPPEDRQANDRALMEGTRILSAYPSKGRRFWIITEADRSVTTVLLPEDY
jgi:hypothetical protein